jgi:hypothetical protein
MCELLACAVRHREFVQQEKASRDDEICRSQFGQQRAIRMQIARTMAAKTNAVDCTVTASAKMIPVAAINASPTNG